MRVYNQQHRFYAGVDLHARSMFTHVLDERGRTVFGEEKVSGTNGTAEAR